MIRFILFALLFFLGYTLFQALFRILGGKNSTLPPEKSPHGEDMVLDPNCGTYVPRSDAVTKVIRGKKVYFCSNACRDAYKGD